MLLITRYFPKFLLMVTQSSPPSSAVRPQLTISLSMGGNCPEGMDYILLVLPREADMNNSLGGKGHRALLGRPSSWDGILLSPCCSSQHISRRHQSGRCPDLLHPWQLRAHMCQGEKVKV